MKLPEDCNRLIFRDTTEFGSAVSCHLISRIMKILDFKNIDYLNIAAYLFFIWFAVWSIVNAQARILISDPAFYLFNIINSSDFFVPGTRQTAVINQVLVVAGVKLKLPLSFLIPLYSFSFVFIRILYFFVVSNLLKNKAAGFAIIAFSVVGVAQSYFRPTSESTIAILNSILLYAWLCYSNKWERFGKWKSLIGFGGAAVLIVFGYLTHPLAAFSIVFMIMFYAIFERKLKTIYPYLMLAFLLVLFLPQVFKGGGNSHQESLLSNFFSSPLAVFSEFKEYYSYKFFDSRFKLLYRPLALLFCSGVVMALIKKKWSLVLFTVLYSAFYFIITCTFFKAGDSDMQMEKIFLPLAVFSSLLFVDSLILSLKKYQIVLGVIILALSINAYFKINDAGSVYNGRIDYLTEIVENASEEENSKLIITREQLNNPRMVFSWAMGIETLMLSTMDKSIEPLTVFTAPNVNEVEEKMKLSDNLIVAPFYTSYNYNSLNKYYFVLNEEEYVLWEIDLK